MLRQGAVHRENRCSSWRNETGLLRFFGNKTTQFFSGQSDWPANNSRKVRLAGMPATAGMPAIAGSLPPMHNLHSSLAMVQAFLPPLCPFHCATRYFHGLHSNLLFRYPNDENLTQMQTTYFLYQLCKS